MAQKKPKNQPAGPTLGIHTVGGGTFNEERGKRLRGRRPRCLHGAHTALLVPSPSSLAAALAGWRCPAARGKHRSHLAAALHRKEQLWWCWEAPNAHGDVKHGQQKGDPAPGFGGEDESPLPQQGNAHGGSAEAPARSWRAGREAGEAARPP